MWLFYLLLLLLPFLVGATENLEEQLTKKHWDPKAAHAVVATNQTYWDTLRPENPSEVKRELDALARLGNFSMVMPLLQQHPEAAALLAYAEDPTTLADVLDHRDCYGFFAGFYQMISVRDEAVRLTEAITRYGDLICTLSQQGIPNAFVFFLFPSDSPGTQEYERWLKEAIEHALRGSEEELQTLLAFVLQEGSDLRYRLEWDITFRRSFRNRLWPAFYRIIQHCLNAEDTCENSIEKLGSTSRVWDLLARPDGEALLAEWGLLAVELLVGEQAIAPDLREVCAEAMFQGDSKTVSAIIKFNEQPLFRQFLLRHDLSPHLKATGLSKLAVESPDRIQNLLTKYMTLTPQALAEDLGPPPSGLHTWLPLYDFYYATKKIVQGREVDMLDAFNAVVDITSSAMFVGKGYKTIQSALKSLPKKSVKEVGKENMKKEGTKTEQTNSSFLQEIAVIKYFRRSQQFLKKEIKDAAKEIKDAAKDKLLGKDKLQDEFKDRVFGNSHKSEQPKTPNTAQPELLPKLPDQSQESKALASTSSDQSIALDVTEPTRWCFEHLFKGKDSIKKVTDLDAQIYMLKSGRILVYPAKNAFFQETAKAALEESENTLVAWQKNASAWWLLVGSSTKDTNQ